MVRGIVPPRHCRAGTYRITEPIVFGPEDSGTEKHSITHAAAPGDKVVISGGRPIAGWKKGAGEIWTVEIPEVKAGQRVGVQPDRDAVVAQMEPAGLQVRPVSEHSLQGRRLPAGERPGDARPARRVAPKHPASCSPQNCPLFTKLDPFVKFLVYLRPTPAGEGVTPDVEFPWITVSSRSRVPPLTT